MDGTDDRSFPRANAPHAGLGTFEPWVLLQLALKQYKAQFDSAHRDQKGDLLFRFLGSVIENAKTHGNAAACADAVRLEELAFDVFEDAAKQAADEAKKLAEAKKAVRRKKPHGKKAAIPPSNLDGRREVLSSIDASVIFSHWSRSVDPEDGKEYRQAFRAVGSATYAGHRAQNQFTLRERVTLPNGAGVVDVVFTATLAAQQQNNDIVKVITITSAIPGVPFLSDPTDPRVLLPDVSVQKQLTANAQSLAQTFRAFPDPSWTWSSDPTCTVEVRRKRPMLRRGAFRGRMLITGGLLLVSMTFGILGCAVAERRAAAHIRHEIHVIGSDPLLDISCTTGAPVASIYFDAPVPDERFARVKLLRNGVPIATLNGLREYHDTGIIRGRQYSYSLRVVGVLGRVLINDDRAVSGRASCASDAAIRAVPVTPAHGDWNTAFTFRARPPAIDGTPRAFAWSWGGTKWDPSAKKMYTVATTPSQQSVLTHRFTPCDDCPHTGTDATGVTIHECSMTLDVTFSDGRRTRYRSQPVRIRNLPPLECRAMPDTITPAPTQ